MENTYDLHNYFDVWYNPEEGWTVNNQCTEATDLHIEPDSTDKEILNFLVTIGFLSTSDMRRVRLENWGDMMEIYAVKRHMPIGALVPVC